MDNDIIEESIELSDYVKELKKPENIIGEFTSTKYMIQQLLKDWNVYSSTRKTI